MSRLDRHKIQILIDMVEKVYTSVLPIGDLQYLHYDIRTRERVFKLKSPISSTFLPVRISDMHFKNRILSMEMLKVFDWYYLAKKYMEQARAERPMYADLKSLSDEETDLFGLNRLKGRFEKMEIYKGLWSEVFVVEGPPLWIGPPI